MKRIERKSVEGETVLFLEPESDMDLAELERLIDDGQAMELGSFAEASRDRRPVERSDSLKPTRSVRRRMPRKLDPPAS